MKPTEKQLQAIKGIEEVLSIKFEGNTKQEAWLWMKEYKPKADEIKRSVKPTEKQLKSIDIIERVLNQRFEGSSRHEAWLWMKDNVPKAIEKMVEERKEQQMEVRVKGIYHPMANPDIEKLRFFDTIESFSETPTSDSLDKEIAYLSMALHIF